MKNLYLVYGYYGVGGAQRRVSNLATELYKRGYGVTIVVALGTNHSITDLNYYHNHEEIPIVFVPDFFEENKGNRIVKRMLCKNIAIIAILKRLKYLSFGISKWRAFFDRIIRQKTNSLQVHAFTSQTVHSR